ncbi:MAG: hypothetical protein US98_C0029G0005 [Parcubacteria group bacterium GW2011_GWC1_38_6]|nr:MAG: hypothetical protein US98_C0029G0005 [Parcubacteria group bacterium GW2011_GWC1_38_6]
MNINFLKYRTLYYILSGVLIVSSLALVLVFGLKMGIDFTGGSIMELVFDGQVPSNESIESSLADLNLVEIIIQPAGENRLILRFGHIEESTHQEILKKIEGETEQSFEAIGPTIGKELTGKTRTATILALLAIASYVAFAFRRVSYPAKSWQYGLATLVALFHDIIIPLGVFAILGEFYNVEINIPFVAALLTVLGFSVHDTIVVFDRIRENLLKRTAVSFGDVVNQSLNQTLVRSINTVLTTLLVLFAIYFFGGESLKYFSLALIIGIVSGAYSSIFIASPLIFSWVNSKEGKRK